VVAVSSGEWVTAAATDEAGNSSEFSPSVRVGTGAIQCGNVGLVAGWNHAGWFGAATVALGDHFPGDPGGLVRAVYELRPDGSYGHWFRDTAIGRTLTSLVPGRAYFFLLDGPLALPAGFSLSSPLGVQLGAGWNSFVYFGASDDAADAMMSISGAGMALYRFAEDESGGHWQTWGTPDLPPYARDFAAAAACESYVVFLDEPATLTPLHP
jgi:hypothetical protein